MVAVYGHTVYSHKHTCAHRHICNNKQYKKNMYGCVSNHMDTFARFTKKHVFRNAGEHHQTSKKHYFHSGCLTVGVLEKPLEKRAGRNFAPPGTKKLIYFVDDMNMPEVDAYGTVQPHTLIRQHLDYSHWYEKTYTSKPV